MPAPPSNPPAPPSVPPPAAIDPLQASELIFRAVSESTRDAIICTDANGVVTYWNRAAKAMFGYRAAEIVGKRLSLLMPERLRAAHERGLKRVAGGGPSRLVGRTVEMTGLHKNGSEFAIEITLSEWQLVGRRYFTALLRDAGALLQSKRLRAVQAAVSQVLAEPTGLIEMAPRVIAAICSAFDWEIGNLWLIEGEPPEMFLRGTYARPDLAKGVCNTMQRTAILGPGEGMPGKVWDTGEPVALSDFAEDPRLPKRPTARKAGLSSACGFPILSGKRVIGAIEFLARQVRVDDEMLEVMRALGRQIGQLVERRRAEEALGRERELLIDAQQIAQIGSWEWDIVKNKVSWSDELFRIWGADPAAFEASYEGYLAQVHPDDRERIDGVIKSAYRDLEPFSFEHRVLRPDGQTRVVSCRGRVIASPEGAPLRMTGTAQDITERRRLEQQLLLGDRLASVGTLAAGMAHEINNPLAYVLANIELLAGQLARLGAAGTEVAPLVEMVALAKDGAERVRRIVRDLRVFARADQDQRRRLDVREVIETAIDIANNEIRHRALLVRDFGEVPHVVADEARLAQVFINLLVNAAQALPEGDAEHQRITVTTAKDGPHAVISVADTGQGIPPELRNRIFDPFFTTKPVGAGTGLGLAICHSLVAALGGEIRVDSEAGAGATFRVLLPAAPPEPERAEAERDDGDAADPATVVATAAASAALCATPAERVDGGPASTPTPLNRVDGGPAGRVLIIDDDPMVLASMKRVLAAHQVTAVGSGKEALAALAEHAFDAILCDLMMPEMTGMDLHATLAADRPSLAARMVFITGGAFTGAARAFLDAVPNERIDKPFEADQLRAVIARLVEAAGAPTMP